MIMIVYSETDQGTLPGKLGTAEYSYWFVLREFRTLLERLGLVVFIRDPAREVDILYRQFQARGESCVFLCFEPPHKIPTGLACPTIPVFAWEFESLPDENWNDDPRSDWRHALRQHGRAITHSGHCVRVTRAAMGEDFPIAAIPAPVWDRFAHLGDRLSMRGGSAHRLRVQGRVIDTTCVDLAAYASPLRRRIGYAPLPPAQTDPTEILLDGVVYTAVFNPVDMRKNWFDMLAGFIWALRHRPDATLVFKLTQRDSSHSLSAMLEDLSKHSPFQCRVLLIDGFLDDESYESLVAATSFVVNASYGEGQCLPLMEFMSAGKPAIAPSNTAMADYVDEDCAFVVRCSREPCSWPHDERALFRTMRWRTDFGSLVAAYEESYRVAAAEPARYARMSAAARESLRLHCSHAVVERRLRDILGLEPAALAPPFFVAAE